MIWMMSGILIAATLTSTFTEAITGTSSVEIYKKNVSKLCKVPILIPYLDKSTLVNIIRLDSKLQGFFLKTIFFPTCNINGTIIDFDF